MKKFLLVAIIGIFAFGGCNQQKPVKTIDNLKFSIINQTIESEMYMDFSEKAKTNYPDIALLFETISKAEGIKASNNKIILESLGEDVEVIIPEYEVRTTLENLQTAIQRETEDVNNLYPTFLSDAKNEKVSKAQDSFQWAITTESKHLEFFSKAIEFVFGTIEKVETRVCDLPSGYAICPTCGNLFYNTAIEEKCGLCQTDKEKFIIVKPSI